jgi:hypothetical protein
MRIGVRLMATGIGLAIAGAIGAPIVRADAPAPAPRPGLVPVVSDDEAEWAKERPPAYLAFGSSVSSDVHLNADLFLEGGMRVATTPIWVHGLIGSGAETQIMGQGRFVEARGGIELSCGQRRAVCGFFGVDVGGELQTRKGDGDDDKLTGVVAVPRMGLDLGGDMVRLRASVDGRWFRYQSRQDSVSTTAGGGGVSLALALRF